MTEQLAVQPETILRMANAYQQAATLISACQLSLFTHLAAGPCSAEELAHRCDVPLRGLQRLLHACVALGLVEKEGEHYRNAPVAAAYLVQGREGYLGDLVGGLTAELYAAWGNLTIAIRQDAPARLKSGQGVLSMSDE